MSVSLLLMGTAALTGCGQKDSNTAKIYKDVDACIADDIFTAERCRSDFAAAEKERLQNAPAYETAAACEKDYGVNDCQPTTDAHRAGLGHFIPFMAGYVVGNTAQTYNANALYQPRGSSDFRTAAGRSLANSTPITNRDYAPRKKDDDTQPSYSSSSGGGGGGGGGSGRWFSERSASSTTTAERGGWGFRGFHLSS
ncbi:DUF1190 domain-containing protein [Rhizobium sp. LEGMi198b]|uniref:DUF1190 domain-containing protein n=1 Tax=unclassified Rhizobium TaxID=2613769 RepID=UPI00131A49AA|nr:MULTISPECIES: DUF1190 domain-containing protein [Rhizobium]MDK4738692.1 DUF1190 domain-containing protein [Rhizobium sp. CNPSo 3464]UWU19696.1 DUF1190 domain-containing protein [Rhizobium tropici]